jgi:hypothetical protein
VALSDNIRLLRDRVVADLSAAHDYYEDSKIAWRTVAKAISSGEKFSIQNVLTGTVATESELATKARGYIAERLAEGTFQQFVSIFENFLHDFLALWLAAYPGSLSAKSVTLRSILDAADKDAIVQLVVSREVNELLYARPSEWFTYLEEKARLGCPTADEIERMAEVKATRDVLVHNRGVANQVYVSKSGKAARFTAGSRVAVPEPYHRATWELLRKLVADICDAAIGKVP